MMRALLIVMVLASTASADDEWAKGVSSADQERAEALLEQGNQLIATQSHGAALDKYRAAAAIWNHPLIRYNMAVAEIRLDRVLDAATDLDAALRYGDKPFTPELYRQALDYKQLVAGRVGEVEASCTQTGVSLSIDGQRWFACPGKEKKRVLAGEHVVVGEKPDFMTVSRRVVVTGNKAVTADVTLLPMANVVKLEYPSPRWAPYTIIAGGVAIAGGGLAVWVAGSKQMDKFNTRLDALCLTGCSLTLDATPVEEQLAEERDSAKLKGRIADVMFAAGGIVAASGVVWAVLNRPHRVLPKAVEVAPSSQGLSATVGWQF